MEKKLKVLSLAQGLGGTNTESEAQNIFLHLEKRNHVKKHIRKLVVTGVITTDPFNILNEEKRFYNDLYKSKLSDTNQEAVKTFLGNLNIPMLSEEQKQLCQETLRR